MKKHNILIVCIGALLFLYGTANATIWYVHPDSALNTIQEGLDSCADNDIVLVGPGTYYENIVWPNTQGIHLVSEVGPEATIIDGDSAGSVITCTTGVDTTTNIYGFTIQNGYALEGGGIYCENSSPSITNVTICRNTGQILGGGILCDNSSPCITDVTIQGNEVFNSSGYPWQYGGGGICCSNNSNPSLTNVTISGNRAIGGGLFWSHGGGIRCEFNSNPHLTNVTISDNSATIGYGGGIVCTNSNPHLNNVIISENTTTIGGGGICCHYSSPTINNVVIYGNTADYDGGGIYCTDSSNPSLTNVTMSGNTASGNGGGIDCYYSSPSLIHVTISDNSGGAGGGGIYCWESSPRLENVIISGNSANDGGGGIYCQHESNPSLENVTLTGNSAPYDGGGIYCGNSNPSILNCILWENTPEEIWIEYGGSVTASYSDIQGGWPGIGNIDADPMFVSGPLSDYHLCPYTPSPCIDAGNPDSQYNDPENPLIPGYAMWPALGTVRNDMGVYGGPGTDVWATGIEEHEPIQQVTTPLKIFPNPFSKLTNISFGTMRGAKSAELKIYDATGRVVKEFNHLSHNQIFWNGTDDSNRQLPSGIYFLKFEAGDYSATEKLLLIR